MMHPDERPVDEALVRRLLQQQFPQWAELSLERVRSTGTDNAIYRLGDELAVRLPRYPAAAAHAEKEARWLPRLAAHLPLDVPVPLGLGRPAGDYPWSWSVCRWLPGESASVDVVDPRDAANALAGFLRALQAIDPAGGPPPGEHNFGRGVPLAQRHEYVRAALSELDGVIDTKAPSAAWDEALAAPEWDRPTVWIHGDLHGGNMLANGGRLSGIIDFGGLAVGDPACDAMVAFTFLPREARAAFRRELQVDDATWARARGWALSMGLIALPYYRETNPQLAADARRWIGAVLDDRPG